MDQNLEPLNRSLNFDYVSTDRLLTSCPSNSGVRLRPLKIFCFGSSSKIRPPQNDYLGLSSDSVLENEAKILVHVNLDGLDCRTIHGRPYSSVRTWFGTWINSDENRTFEPIRTVLKSRVKSVSSQCVVKL